MKNKIKELRLEAGYTQKQLALETGQYNPSLLLAYRLARIFSTTVGELYCLEENLKEEDQKYEKL